MKPISQVLVGGLFRHRKGGVYEFGREQATRIVRVGIAKPAKPDTKTARQEDRETLMQDAAERAKVEDLDQAMSAAWDVDVRDLERAELEAAAAEEAAEAATAAVKRAQGARKLTAAAPAPSSEPVHIQVER